jgi:regulator of extracellular matrix RemA (YlzA/DUF370 family)
MLVNVGFGNMVNKDRIIAVVNPDTAPIKRLVQDSKDSGRAIDVTCGRRTRSVILTDSDHVILSAVQPETVANRLSVQDDEQAPASREPDTLNERNEPDFTACADEKPVGQTYGKSTGPADGKPVGKAGGKPAAQDDSKPVGKAGAAAARKRTGL